MTSSIEPIVNSVDDETMIVFECDCNQEFTDRETYKKHYKTCQEYNRNSSNFNLSFFFVKHSINIS